VDIENIHGDEADSDSSGDTSEDDSESDPGERQKRKKRLRKPYIEMNLGLGVFEQIPSKAESSNSDEGSSAPPVHTSPKP